MSAVVTSGGAVTRALRGRVFFPLHIGVFRGESRCGTSVFTRETGTGSVRWCSVLLLALCVLLWVLIDLRPVFSQMNALQMQHSQDVGFLPNEQR